LYLAYRGTHRGRVRVRYGEDLYVNARVIH
jgi:hypothetical protein